MAGDGARIGVDIGGTFTDVVLEQGERRVTAKVLTTPRAPEQAVLQAIAQALGAAGLGPADAAVIIHGTTLATNALIERKGARTGFLTTAGFRDAVEIGQESRPDMFDVFADKPLPLVPRRLRLPVTERVDARGRVLVPLDLRSADAAIDQLEKAGVEAVAIGFMHGYANPAHEEVVAERVAKRLPQVPVSISAEVAPEMREYERFSTTCANAYVQPLMGRYLRSLQQQLASGGFACPLLLMLSGGGVTDVETAIRFPVRLVESGPAGGAVLACHIAEAARLPRVLSFDMGGTTAKICLIENARPETSRTFEVARVYRFRKGSGLPLRMPVVEMVEIGAGGGSIARVDALGRIAVGPDSAGSEPGPVSYGRGGSAPTVTDADLVLGKIDADRFAGGSIRLDQAAAEAALGRTVGGPMRLSPALAAYGVQEMVDETMANAARVHAIERGKDLAGFTMVAFGGAAPLHAARLAEKLGLPRVVIPSHAGVGSALGFLRAPVSFEVARSDHQRMSAFAPERATQVLGRMAEEARAVVARAAGDAATVETRTAAMRYVGQGHEITVALPARDLGADDRALLLERFGEAYKALFGQTLPGLDVEVLSWSVVVSTEVTAPASPPMPASRPAPPPAGTRRLFDAEDAAYRTIPFWHRADLGPGMTVPGPAILVEDETSTYVTGSFTASIDALGYITLDRRETAA